MPQAQANAYMGLHRVSRDSHFRKWRPNLAREVRELMTEWRQRALVSDARYVYSSTGGTVAGAVHAKSDAVVGDAWRAVYLGEDRNFQRAAEQILNEDWLPRSNIMGGPFDWAASVWIGSKSIDVDGDFFILPTYTESGEPALQYIEGHRVATRLGQEIVKSGPFRGAKIVHGIAVDRSGRPLAAQILGADESGKDDEIISLAQLILCFDPRWFSQYRGIPSLAYSVLDWYDLGEIREAEIVGVKARSKIIMLERTQSGRSPSALEIMNGSSSADGGAAVQELADGMIRYVQSRGDISAFDANRPGDAWQSFVEMVQRGALIGMDWPPELVWKMEGSGAPARAVIKRANRSAKRRQKVIACAYRRAALHGLSHYIDRGELPMADDWWRWGFTMPPELSVDDGNDRKADREDYRIGLLDEQTIVERRYDISYEDYLQRRARSEKRKLEVAAEHGLDPQRMGIQTPNANETFADATARGRGGEDADAPDVEDDDA